MCSQASAFNNSGCIYSCETLCAHFALDCAVTRCLIDGSSGGERWPATNATISVAAGAALMIQGRASGLTPLGRSLLLGRIEGTAAGGATVVLRHTAMVALSARSDSIGNIGDGGAVNLQRANLTVECCLFRHNRADDGGAIAASGQIKITDSVFENNTGIYGGGGTFLQPFYRAIW